jgi:tRNA threonylcarbamoyladenosine biosynthesis protein TsaB
MHILAVDTATEVCGVALAREDGHVQAELRLNQGLTHTAALMAAIEAVLGLVRLTLDEVDAFAVTQGPGSFTGLRIGISTVKGLAMATGKPLVGVSTLAALAHQASEGTPWVCPMIDARRRQVYWSVYQRQGAVLVPVQPEQVGPALNAADQVSGPCLFIGNGVPLYGTTLRERLPQWFQAAGGGLDAISPGAVARLAGQRLGQGVVQDVHRFEPVYLRPSDAEQGSGG